MTGEHLRSCRPKWTALESDLVDAQGLEHVYCVCQQVCGALVEIVRRCPDGQAALENGYMEYLNEDRKQWWELRRDICVGLPRHVCQLITPSLDAVSALVAQQPVAGSNSPASSSVDGSRASAGVGGSGDNGSDDNSGGGSHGSGGSDSRNAPVAAAEDAAAARKRADDAMAALLVRLSSACFVACSEMEVPLLWTPFS